MVGCTPSSENSPPLSRPPRPSPVRNRESGTGRAAGQRRRQRVRRPPRRPGDGVVDVSPRGEPVEQAGHVEQVPVVRPRRACRPARARPRSRSRRCTGRSRVDCARLGGGDVRVAVRVEVGVVDPRARVVREVARAGATLPPMPRAIGAMVTCGTVHQITCRALDLPHRRPTTRPARPRSASGRQTVYAPLRSRSS